MSDKFMFLSFSTIELTSILPPQTIIRHFDFDLNEILLFKIGTRHAAAAGSGTIFNLSITKWHKKANDRAPQVKYEYIYIYRFK